MRPSLRLLLVVALVAGALVAPSGLAEAITRPETLYHERAVGSAPVRPGFPIDYVGVVFELPSGADADHDHAQDDDHGTEALAVRFRHDGVWGPWQPVPEDGAQAVGTWTGALVDGGDAEAYQVRGLPHDAGRARAAALNTTDGEPVVVGRRPTDSAGAVTKCKSRLDWRADETIRRGTRSFAPMQVATVHHTATANNDDNPDARVRAIYEYHVLTNGWDDIGYQALISEDGTVYEGRWRGTDSPSCATSTDGTYGTGWEFGHQTTDANAHIVTGAHTGGYNTGNFGVALLGTFTGANPKPAARDALVEYLAELFARHGLDPETKVLYSNTSNSKEVWTISGHRDFTSTQCPGGKLYNDLPTIRGDVAAAVAPDTEEPAPDGPVDDVAVAEATASGKVTGSYLDTHVDDGTVQTVAEVTTGGKPGSRQSLLDHTWTLNVTGGSTVTLYVDAAAGSSTDPDDFAFSYSVDGGRSYTDAFTVSSTTPGVHSVTLPAGTQGEVRVRVVDTDRTRGETSIDSIAVDHLFVRSG